MDKHSLPLVVDLDGTLIKSDLLLESLFSMIKTAPRLLLCVPFWFLRGKAYMKSRIAEHSSIDARTLPYQEEFVNNLRARHKQGGRLVLATASDRKFATGVADHLGLFEAVFASNGSTNLSGRKKLEMLLNHYGEKGFDYAGNGRPDLEIFPHARHAILVNPSPSVRSSAPNISTVEKIFEDQPATLWTYIKAIRAYQWVKNLLLFIPLVTSHQWTNTVAVSNLLLGFLSFGLCASGGYLLNDLLDLTADRNHPRKKNRPLANGTISVWTGGVWMLFLQATGLGLAASLDLRFFILLLGYCAISLAYTFHLKTYALIDVLILAGLYTLRVMAGGILAQAPISFWLFAFSIFIFFSLALIKRCSELATLTKNKTEYAKGRDYSISDNEYLREMGIASGYMAILIFALYINSPDVLIRYSHPQVLWLACPALFYWISRLWLKTGRGEMHDDPIVFSMKDRGTRVIALVLALVILLAI